MSVSSKIGIRFAILIFFNVVWLIAGNKISAQNYWDAILQLGFNPLTQHVDPQLACKRIERIDRLHHLISDHLEADPELVLKMRDVHSRLNRLDVANIYDLLPYADQQAQRRGVGFRGGQTTHSYHLSMVDPWLEEQINCSSVYYPFMGPENHQFGDMYLRAFIKPLPKETYRIATKAQFCLDDIPATIIPRIVDRVLTAAWINARAVELPSKYLDQNNLDRMNARFLVEFSRDFPNLLGVILRYFEIDSIITSDSDDAGRSVLFDVKVRFKQEALLNQYPNISKLLDDLKNNLFFRMRLYDSQDRLMGIAELDSVDKLMIAQFRLMNGQLVPLDNSQSSFKKAGFRFVTPGFTRLRTAYDIHLNIVGLRIDIESLQVALDYLYCDQTAELKACLWEKPAKIDAGGWAFGFVPLWLVDLLIPSNVEDITKSFFHTLTLGNDGEGANLEIIGFLDKITINNILLQADADVLGNGAIKLAFNLQRKLFTSQEALIKEFKAFNNQLIHAFYQDFLRMRVKIGCQ